MFDTSKSHHGESGFISHVNASLFDYLKMRFKEKALPEVKDTDIVKVQRDADLALIHSPSEQPQVTWIGHATVMVQYRGVTFLTDPHLSKTAAPLDGHGPERFTPPALSIQQMPMIDFIVISHNHYDHLDRETVELFANRVKWFIPLGLKSWFEDLGVEAGRLYEMDWWQQESLGDEIEVTFTPTNHWSQRKPWDFNKSLWGSWAIKIGDFTCWYAGDTAYDEERFKEIGERIGSIDLAFIPIGGYAPRYFMKAQHIDPYEAVMIHQDIGAKQSISIHWGTFVLSHEPFLEPPQLLLEALEEAELDHQQFKSIKIGETFVLEAFMADDLLSTSEAASEDIREVTTA